jgi:O-glycosyl hydrolase
VDDGSDASGFTWAQHIYTDMTSANLSAFLYWWGLIGSGTTDNEGLLQLTSSERDQQPPNLVHAEWLSV